MEGHMDHTTHARYMKHMEFLGRPIITRGSILPDSSNASNDEFYQSELAQYSKDKDEELPYVISPGEAVTAAMVLHASMFQVERRPTYLWTSKTPSDLHMALNPLGFMIYAAANFNLRRLRDRDVEGNTTSQYRIEELVEDRSFDYRLGKSYRKSKSKKSRLRSVTSIFLATMAGIAVIRIVITGLAYAGISLAGLTSGRIMAATQSTDPCAAIANQTYVVPSKVIACLNSFSFNTTLRDNTVDVVSKTLNFHTSTNYQLWAPPPFWDVHVDVQGELQRIKRSSYSSDYELHKDVSSQFMPVIVIYKGPVRRLFDGHCVYINFCYDSLFVTYLPFPLVNLNSGYGSWQQDVYIAPEAFDVVSKEFVPFIDDWQALAGYNFTKYSGAKVIAIDGFDPWWSIENNANVIGSWQGRSSRENSFFSSYLRAATEWSYRMGDFAARSLPPTQDYVKMTVIPVNSTRFETIKVPFISKITAPSFTDGPDLWQNNCVAKANTNGIDYFASSTSSISSKRSGSHKEGSQTDAENEEGEYSGPVLVDPSPPKFAEPIAPKDRKHPISSFIDVTALTDISLPPSLNPGSQVSGSGTASFFVQGKVGILALGSFSSGAGYDAWFQILSDGLNALKDGGATHLIVDVTNNGGGYICVANFLHRFLAGPSAKTEPQAGFDTKARYNSLASNITNAIIKGGISDLERGVLLYDPISYRYANSSKFFPESYNWLEPPVQTTVNGRQDAFSQKLGDECQPFPLAVPAEPLFPPENIGIVNNGRCASSCSIFTIAMSKKEGVKIAVLGGRQFTPQQYTGTVGGQSTSFTTIDSEIKSTHLKNSSFAPPDFIGNAYQGLTWRLGFGVLDGVEPEEWENHQSDDNFPLTFETVNRPDAIWKDLTARWWPGLQ